MAGVAGGAPEGNQRKEYREIKRGAEHHGSSVTDFLTDLPNDVDTRCASGFLRRRRLAQGAVHQALHRAHQVRRFVGALGDHGIGAGVLFGESQGSTKPDSRMIRAFGSKMRMRRINSVPFMRGMR